MSDGYEADVEKRTEEIKTRKRKKKLNEKDKKGSKFRKEITNILLNDNTDEDCTEHIDEERLVNLVIEEENIDECPGSVTDSNDDDNSDEWEHYSDFACTDSSNSDSDSDW